LNSGLRSASGFAQRTGSAEVKSKSEVTHYSKTTAKAITSCQCYWCAEPANWCSLFSLHSYC